MTGRSFNEVELTVRKACSGLGWDYGVAEEFGRAAVWLTEWTDLSLAPLVDLAFGDQRRAECAACDDGFLLPAATANSVISGLDLLAARPDSRIRFCRSVAGFPALAGFAGAAARSFRREFRIDHGGRTALVGPDGLRGDNLSGIPGSGWTVTCAGLTTQDSFNTPRKPARADIPVRLWEDICALAARTYTPATERSRQFGAGAQAS